MIKEKVEYWKDSLFYFFSLIEKKYLIIIVLSNTGKEEKDGIQ